MGGNSFNNTRRVHKSELKEILDDISYVTNLSRDMIECNLLGSAGKQETSGDIDIVLDSNKFNITKLSLIVRNYVGDDNISTRSLANKEFQTSWPVPKTNDRVQVDFISGDVEWLKFTHYSPGDKSDYKGVFLTVLFGVLAKIQKEFEVYSLDNIRFAKVGFSFDTTKGLHRVWKLKCKQSENIKKVSPEYWETNFDKVAKKHNKSMKTPRFGRTGFITDPEAIIHILFQDQKLNMKDVDTFEKAWEKTKEKFPSQLKEIKHRVIESLNRNSVFLSRKELENLSIWNEV